ncbi:hypothetical protein QUF56_09395 [Ureibacillus composti]|nr:hypothetical protein [Ureibacillus composti]
MAFVKTEFVNGQAPAVSAEELNKFGDGILEAINSVLWKTTDEGIPLDYVVGFVDIVDNICFDGTYYYTHIYEGSSTETIRKYNQSGVYVEGKSIYGDWSCFDVVGGYVFAVNGRTGNKMEKWAWSTFSSGAPVATSTPSFLNKVGLVSISQDVHYVLSSTGEFYEYKFSTNIATLISTLTFKDSAFTSLAYDGVDFYGLTTNGTIYKFTVNGVLLKTIKLNLMFISPQEIVYNDGLWVKSSRHSTAQGATGILYKIAI